MLVKEKKISYLKLQERTSSPKEVKLVRELDTGESYTIRCEDVTSSDTMIRCKLGIPDKPEKVGTWTVVVINSQYADGRLVNGFTVKKEESDVTGKEEESG